MHPLETEPLTALVLDLQATVLILSEEAQQDPSIVKQAADLHAGGLRVRNLEGFYDVWLGKLPISSLNQMALLTDIGEIHGSAYTHLKRFTDLLFGLAAGVLFVVVTPVIGVLNIAGNRGPLIYRQPRMGKSGETFQIAKFRTMRPEALSATTPWTVADDPRITRFGRVLRKTHLDELPQFWNILAGDLSVVGPRPEQPHYVEELRKKIPFYDVRHTVQPGLTGWAQVKYRYASTEADAFEKLQYDLYYLRHQSISLDFQIISRTIVSVLRAHGR